VQKCGILRNGRMIIWKSPKRLKLGQMKRCRLVVWFLASKMTAQCYHMQSFVVVGKQNGRRTTLYGNGGHPCNCKVLLYYRSARSAAIFVSHNSTICIPFLYRHTFKPSTVFSSRHLFIWRICSIFCDLYIIAQPPYCSNKFKLLDLTCVHWITT